MVVAYLSLDEATTIHEQAEGLSDVLEDLGGVLFFGWVLVGGLFVLVVGAAYLPLLRALPKRTRALFLAAGALYVGDALGLELVAGLVADRMADGYWSSWQRVVLTHVEELAEMVGVVIFIHALLDYWPTAGIAETAPAGHEE